MPVGRPIPIEPDRERLVSIIVPFFNEEESLAELVRRTEDCARPLPVDYEIVFVNDGSTDAGPQIVKGMCAGLAYGLSRTATPSVKA